MLSEVWYTHVQTRLQGDPKWSSEHEEPLGHPVEWLTMKSVHDRQINPKNAHKDAHRQ